MGEIRWMSPPVQDMLAAGDYDIDPIRDAQAEAAEAAHAAAESKRQADEMIKSLQAEIALLKNGYTTMPCGHPTMCLETDVDFDGYESSVGETHCTWCDDINSFTECYENAVTALREVLALLDIAYEADSRPVYSNLIHNARRKLGDIISLME